METTIKVTTEIRSNLNKFKIHHRETYNDVLTRLLNSVDEEKESLTETLEVLSDPETMRNLAESIEDINNREKWVSWDKIKNDL